MNNQVTQYEQLANLVDKYRELTKQFLKDQKRNTKQAMQAKAFQVDNMLEKMHQVTIKEIVEFRDRVRALRKAEKKYQRTMSAMDLADVKANQKVVDGLITQLKLKYA